MNASDLGVRIVAEGVDGMALNVKGVLDESAYGRLDHWRASAEAAQEQHVALPVVDWGGRAFEVMSTGARGGWRYVLKSEDLTVVVRPRPKLEDEHLVMQAQIRAAWCWRDGHVAVAQAIEEWATGVGVRDATIGLSRIDLTVDWQADLDIEGPTCPLDAHGTWVIPAALHRQDHRDGERWTGTRWGTPPGVLVRFYDKSREIRVKSGKAWFDDVWERSGCYDPTKPVLRLEVAVPRSLLRDCERGGRATASWWWAQLPALWRRVTRKTLSLRTRMRDTHRDRWPMHPLWHLLHDRPTFAGAAAGELVPRGASGAEVRRAMAGVIGYLRLLAVASGTSVENLRTDSEAVLAACCVLMHEFPFYWASVQRRSRSLLTWRESVADRRALAFGSFAPSIAVAASSAKRSADPGASREEERR